MEIWGAGNPLAHAQKSPIAHNQGVNPTWDMAFSFTIDDYFISESELRNIVRLYVTVLAKNKYFPNRRIGHATIPLAKLLQSQSGESTSYPLTNCAGECLGCFADLGTVHLSISIGPVVTVPLPAKYYSGNHLDTRRYPSGTGSEGGSYMLAGMALGFAMR